MAISNSGSVGRGKPLQKRVAQETCKSLDASTPPSAVGSGEAGVVRPAGR